MFIYMSVSIIDTYIDASRSSSLPLGLLTALRAAP